MNWRNLRFEDKVWLKHDMLFEYHKLTRWNYPINMEKYIEMEFVEPFNKELSDEEMLQIKKLENKFFSRLICSNCK